MIEGGGEDDVRDAGFAFDEFFEDAETVEAGHLHVEKNEVGGMFFDEIDGFEAVFALRDQIYFGEGFEEKGEFVPGGLFVVDDERVDGHMGGQTQYRRVGRARKGADGSPQRYREGRRKISHRVTEGTERKNESEDRPTQSQRGKARKGTG